MCRPTPVPCLVLCAPGSCPGPANRVPDSGVSAPGTVRSIGSVQGIQGCAQCVARRRRHGFKRQSRGFGAFEWCSRCFRNHFGGCQPDGSGQVDEFGCGKAQFGVPHRRVNDKNEFSAHHIPQPAMVGQGRRQTGAKLLFQCVQPDGTTHRVSGGIRHRGLQGRQWG